MDVEFTADVEAQIAEVQRLRRNGEAYDALEAERDLYAGLLDDFSRCATRGPRLLTLIPLASRVRAIFR